jgi:hypothetical protein
MPTINLYQDMQKALLGEQKKVEVQPFMTPASMTKEQSAAHIMSKLLGAWEEKQAKETRSQDRASANKILQDYIAPQTPFSTEKYGTSPEDLMRLAAEGYDGSDEDGEPILSAEDQRKFYTEEANRVRSAFNADNPTGAALVRRQAAAGAYNMPDQRGFLGKIFGAEERKEMGPAGEATMMQVLMREKDKNDAVAAAELARTQEMETFGDKERIKAQYKVDPYQRPYDTTSGIKNAERLKELRLALKNAVGPEERKLAEQNLQDFEYVLSKDPDAIRIQEQSRTTGAAAGKEAATNRSDWDRASASMPSLLRAVASLRDLSKTATYTKGGQLLDYLNRQTGRDPREGAVARAKTIAMVKNNVLKLLRETFGAAFTAAEGDSLLTTYGDPDMSPQEKNAVLDALIESKTAELETKRRLVMRGENPVSTGGPLAPPAFSEADIVATMKANNMTREQVMERLGAE